VPDANDEILVAYCSAASYRFSREGILELLDLARRNNARDGITGVLLYVDESFFQVLEGERTLIEALYAKIERDQRHCEMTKLIEKPIASRTFAGWSMGYAALTREELAALPGMNDFFKDGSSFDALPQGLARKLLEAFKDGQWRRRLVVQL
jgi:hypothetical protein